MTSASPELWGDFIPRNRQFDLQTRDKAAFVLSLKCKTISAFHVLTAHSIFSWKRQLQDAV